MFVLMPGTEIAEKLSKHKQPACCYHCGEACDDSIQSDGYLFCCEGRSFVYILLKENGLCNYYVLGQAPASM